MYTVENIERAVTLFYKSEAGQQAEAHQWLTEAQNSMEAWSFVWELLDPRRSSEVQFFAATTLHSKLLKNWNEVPSHHYELLKKRILQAIVTYAMGPKLVLNRLCITLSAYIIHTIPTHWPNAFEELVSSFQPHHLPNVDPEQVVWILLEILSVIPEEFQSTVLSASQRIIVGSALQRVSKDILKVVEMCLLPITNGSYNMVNFTTYLNSSRCASAWIQLGGITIEECSHIINLLVDLACYTYWNKLDEQIMTFEELELFEVSLEALSSVMVQPQTIKYPKYITKHTSYIINNFGKILEQEHRNPELNKDVIPSIYGLIVTIADTHSRLLISYFKSNDPEEQKLGRDILNCLLGCSDLAGMYPVDETSSSLTFGFWYTLQDTILSLDAAEYTELLTIVKPYYHQLVCVMLRKSMYPSNLEDCPNAHWSLDDREMFRCYRQDIADTFMYCYNMLNIEILDIFHTKLTESLEQCVGNPTHYWNAVESCLHAFSAVAECIEQENLYLPKLMMAVRNISYHNLHIKVLATALDTIGAYSEWMIDHPEVLSNIIPLIISGLNNTDVAPNATLALKDISTNCQKFLPSYSEHLLMACQSVLQIEHLQLAERIRIMHSIGLILSVLPINQIMEYLNVIVGSSIEEIQSLISAPSSVGSITSLITRLKMLSALFLTLSVKQLSSNSVQQPIVLVVQNTLPIYIQISNKFRENSEVIEVLCELLKHTITSLMDDCKVLIPNYLQLLVDVYNHVPQPSILLLAKIILIMFGKEENLIGMLNQFLCELVNTTLQLCAELNNTNQLSEKSDVLEAFFSMLSNVTKRNVLLIVSSGLDCTALFQCAVLCLSLPETQTLKNCTSFLVNYISLSRENGQTNVVQKCGEALVHRVLLNLGGASSRSAADILADILLVLNRKYCDNLSRWLNTQLVRDGFPSNLITAQQKEHFIKLVIREKANKRKLAESVTEFTLICRGIIKPNNSGT